MEENDSAGCRPHQRPRQGRRGRFEERIPCGPGSRGGMVANGIGGPNVPARGNTAMQLRLWWWRKVRYATIPKEARDIFERFGDSVIGSVVTNGMGQRHGDLHKIYTDTDHMLTHATAWLTERADLRELHEQRLETAEWAILVFVIVGVVLDLLLVSHGFGH
jgi:hypothetical protein